MRTIPGVTGSKRRGVSAWVKVALIGPWIIMIGCTGPTGPQGPEGPPGTPGGGGDGGTNGQQGCPGLSPGQTVGLAGTIQVSAPPNGSFFVAGDKPVLTIKLNTVVCSHVLTPTELGQLSQGRLMVSGPRSTLLTTTSVKLLNAVTNRGVAQHHYIDVRTPTGPNYADPTQGNLTIGSDGTITYRLAAVSDESTTRLMGTYTAGIWAVSKDGIDQVLLTADLQIGTATLENYASGNPPATKCYDCHLGSKSGKSYQAHILPGFSPFGNYALDQTPISNCQLCHNTNGYSVNPIVRKVHGAHRGENQKAPGVAHPEYGLGDDPSLRDYTNISFPPLLAHEKDCTVCHTDNRFKTSVSNPVQGPSRLACGTCHDNLFFDTAILNPPRNFGRPSGSSGPPCQIDSDCTGFGNYVTCDVPTGNCLRTNHGSPQTNDSQCAFCHTADPPGLSPISAKHQVYERTSVRKLKIANYAIAGGTGPGGAFLVGDTPTINFKLTCELSTPTSACPPDGIVADLQGNSNLSGSLVSAGPSTDRQRIYGPNGTVNIKTTGTLTFNAGTGLYTYVFPTPIPAQAFTPLNNPTATPRQNVSGSYTVYLYITEQFSNPSFRDYASVVKDFNLVVGNPADARPRQVISNAACNSCHIETALHGTSRRDPEACGVCHTNGAQDRIEGGTGISCTTDDQCPGHALGWEACRGTPGVCTIIQDPTPNITIKFPILVHKIHFARLLEGYAERNDIVLPGQLAYVGFQNSVVNLSEILFPQDVRNCTKCHADAVQPVNGAATCTATAQCGIGQECQASKCVNRAWVKPTGDACTSCHDADHAFGHVQINTWQSPDGPVETCEVCHGVDADFAVEKVHNIWNPYVPPYPRTKE